MCASSPVTMPIAPALRRWARKQPLPQACPPTLPGMTIRIFSIPSSAFVPSSSGREGHLFSCDADACRRSMLSCVGRPSSSFCGLTRLPPEGSSVARVNCRHTGNVAGKADWRGVVTMGLPCDAANSQWLRRRRHTCLRSQRASALSVCRLHGSPLRHKRRAPAHSPSEIELSAISCPRTSPSHYPSAKRNWPEAHFCSTPQLRMGSPDPPSDAVTSPIKGGTARCGRAS